MNTARKSHPPLRPEVRARFRDVQMDGPLDVGAEIAQVPADATISGMFLMPMAAESARQGKPLPSARERYNGFSFYPLREHVQLMFEAAEALFPRVSARRAMRKLGRGAAPALLDTTLGRVVLATAITPVDALAALAKAYDLNLKPGRAEVTDAGRGFAVVELREIHYLVDSNHVGAVEGILRRFDLRPQVYVNELGQGRAELLVTWPE